MLLLSFCSSTSKVLVCPSTSYGKQWVKLGLEFHMTVGFDLTNQGIFPSSPSFLWSAHLSQINTGIRHAFPGNTVLAARTSSFRQRDILCHFYLFTAVMYNQEGGGHIFQTGMLEVKLLSL